MRSVITTLGIRKTTSVFLISALIAPQIVSAADLSNMSCWYASNYNKCVLANQTWEARSIEDFVCIEQKWWWERMLLQIILDEKFKEIDKDAEEYLEKLEESKDYYFWAEPQESFLVALDDISANFAQYESYWQRYNAVCNGIIAAELMSCVETITTTNIASFLSKSDVWKCEALFETKLEIYARVAYDILKLNRLAVRQDDRKEYVIQQRDKYNWVMQLMLNILGYVERIVNGWVTKTKDPYPW